MDLELGRLFSVILVHPANHVNDWVLKSWDTFLVTGREKYNDRRLKKWWHEKEMLLRSRFWDVGDLCARMEKPLGPEGRPSWWPGKKLVLQPYNTSNWILLTPEWARKQLCPRFYGKKHSPTGTFVIDQWDLLWTSNPQNCRIIGFCCFKHLYLW